MKIEKLFKRDIYRPINGVVKADQLDESSVWQELDEFVVTEELHRHFNDLVAVLVNAMDKSTDASGMNGIWVSGFFGCGKSHFIKVLSYVLENQEHKYKDKSKQAVAFFKDKLGDPLLFADLKKIVSQSTDTILFNVDSKADHSEGRAALLRVFLKVLNEKQGYSSDHPHVAHMERYLDEQGKLAEFHKAFEKAAGEPWAALRDAWEFHRDDVMSALQSTTKMSKGSAEKWVEGAEENFALSPENLAKWAKRYLDSQGPDHRLMFLVDEVGQFIGNDTHLMLNLQTITEQLGTVCEGRAWVVVTSQEDLDAVLGDLKSTKQHDFSKIQGRFKTRLSLSSSNADEVIKRRLLEKKDKAAKPLYAAYEGKHDLLRNYLSFVNTGMSFKSFTDEEDFAACYPFPAYQFALVQKVFESIRKAGATGTHLSHGERSTLDAFQSAAKKLGKREVGALVPFYEFYPAVEGFLDTAVKKTIDQAGESHVLEPFDATMLKVLFLIRYIDELPGSVDNLVTLCIDQIDPDKLALRKKIEASLARLESETLVGRNGELYSFLTNEERDIGREIKNVDIASGAEERELGRMIFEAKTLYAEQKKHTYSETGRDFAFNRICDDHVVGSKNENSLDVAVVSPLGERYPEFLNDANCIMHTSNNEGRVLIRLPDDATLARELRTYLQTESYVKTKHTNSLPETTKRILRDRSEENRGRRTRIVTGLREMLSGASYFACGGTLELKSAEPKEALGQALEYLIKNSFPKMSYIAALHPNPKQEIQTILRADDVQLVNTAMSGPDANTKAIKEVRDYIDNCRRASKQIILHELIEKRFGERPYGWPELEVVLLIARLAVLKEIDLLVEKAPLKLDQAYEHITTPKKQRKVLIVQRQIASSEILENAQSLGKDLFGKQGPSAEDKLYAFLKEHLQSWHANLGQYQALAQTGNYPGLDEITTALADLRKLVEEGDTVRFLERFVANKSELHDLAEEYGDLKGFYETQKHIWETLRSATTTLGQNRLQLEQHPEAGPALRQMEEILKAKKPYGMLQQVSGLLSTATTVNEQLVAEARKPACIEIQGLIDGVTEELGKASAKEPLQSLALASLQKLLTAASSAPSVAHIAQARQAAEPAYDQALSRIEDALKAEAAKLVDDNSGPVTPPPPKKRRSIEVKALCTKSFLEDQADVDAFITTLRKTLEEAISAGERVQIK